MRLSILSAWSSTSELPLEDGGLPGPDGGSGVVSTVVGRCVVTLDRACGSVQEWSCWRGAWSAWVTGRYIKASAFGGLFSAVVCVVVGLSL
jgi:hypothetical protein